MGLFLIFLAVLFGTLGGAGVEIIQAPVRWVILAQQGADLTAALQCVAPNV